MQPESIKERGVGFKSSSERVMQSRAYIITKHHPNISLYNVRGVPLNFSISHQFNLLYTDFGEKNSVLIKKLQKTTKTIQIPREMRCKCAGKIRFCATFSQKPL